MQIWPWWKNEPHAAVDDGRVQVGVLQHDQGGVAAEFQVGALEVAAGGLADRAARGGRTGEGDDRHVRVGDQRLPGARRRRAARAARPRGSPASSKTARERHAAADRGARVRLEHDGVAEGERRGDRADGEDQRGVEGRDHARRRRPGPGGCRISRAPRGRQDLPDRARGERGGLVALLGGDVQFEVGLAGDGAGLAHEPLAQFVGVRGEQVAGPAQHGGPDEVRGAGPLGLGGAGRLGGRGDVLRGGEGDGTERVAGGGLGDGVFAVPTSCGTARSWGRAMT